MKITTNKSDLNFPCYYTTYEDGIKIGKELIRTCSLPNCRTAIGLAHNQIRGNKRVYIVRDGGVWKTYINAEIVSKRGDFVHKESCMSLPKKKNQNIGVNRAESVVINHLTKNGMIAERFEGFISCVHQHEIDHLNGITICDRNEMDSHQCSDLDYQLNKWSK